MGIDTAPALGNASFPELDHLAASGLGVGMLYVANQSESKLASNQWDIGMEITLGVISVGSTVPGKQPAELSIFLCDFQELHLDFNSEPAWPWKTVTLVLVVWRT